jgi:hypothetical protein
VQVWQLVSLVVDSQLLVVLGKKLSQLFVAEQLFVLGLLSLRQALLGFLQLLQQGTD